MRSVSFAALVLPPLLLSVSSSSASDLRGNGNGSGRSSRRPSDVNVNVNVEPAAFQEEPSTERVLSTMDHTMFSPLPCNAALTVADCVPTSANYGGTLSSLLLLASTTPLDQEAVVIPCGQCVVVDTTDGSTTDLSPHGGLNVEGMLHFPPTANLTVTTTHVAVQGILQMDPPDSNLGNRVRIRLVGSDDVYVHPHPDNAMACDTNTGCKIGKKAIAVLGGRLAVRGLEDGTCPSWSRLRSLLPPGGTSDTTPGCDLVHDLTVGDGTFDDGVVGTAPDGWHQHHGGQGSTLTVVADAAEDGGNQYLTQAGRCCDFSGLGIDLDTTCADPPSASNNGGRYRFTMRYRTHGGSGTGTSAAGETNGSPMLQLWPSGYNVPGKCPPAIDGEWVTCDQIITLPEQITDAASASMVISMSVHPSKSIDYDDVTFAAVPTSHEIVVSDPKAAECWGARPSDEVLITNSKSSGGWSDQVVKTVRSVDATTGRISFAQTDGFGGDDDGASPTSLDDDLRTASEVAWLSRPIVFEADGDGPSDGTYDALHGGHLIVLHTPHVAQHLEGVEIRNFGQQGILGRYPVHFHMSGSVAGSVVRKNVVRESKQRCVVIHGSHDVLVEDNVSFDSYGHCYILEDGGEHDNTFRNNLGARTRGQGISIGSTDNEASTIWITNPNNHFIDNVCAGSQNTGIWFELRAIRGASAGLPENEGVNPGSLPLYTFRGNTAHSNDNKGMTTYAPGYCPQTEALFEGISSYHNGIGLFLHGTCRVRVKDAYLGFNDVGLLYFANGANSTIEDSTFVGKCGQTGISLSLEPRSSQVQVHSTSFKGYDYTDDCGGSALAIDSNQPKSEYDMPVLSNLSFDSSAANPIVVRAPFEDRNIFVEDRDGTMNPSGFPGFYLNDAAHMTAFIDSDLCSSPIGSSHGLFCKNTCLRRLRIDTGCCSKKFESPSLDYQMVVTSKTDPDKVFIYDKYIIQAGLWYQANQFDVVLPLDEYSVHFLTVPDGKEMLPPVTLTFDDETNLDDPPSCDHITEASIDFVCPQPYVLSADGVTCGLDTPSPTSSPTIAPAISAYYLACGVSTGCGGQTAIAFHQETHEVRCCRDEALSGWSKYSTCPYNVWGESKLTAMPDSPADGCYHAETHLSAAAICAANNGRLCTKEELLGDCTKHTGCGHDADLIWSSTPVEESLLPCTLGLESDSCESGDDCCSGVCHGDGHCIEQNTGTVHLQ